MNEKEKEDLTPKTRREILMCRRAATQGADVAFQHSSLGVWDRPSWPGTLEIARKLDPLPKKTVMREVTTSHGLRYRVRNGILEYLCADGWARSANSDFRIISDLYANPTVEVDDDGTD